MSTRLIAGKDFAGDGHSDLFGLRSSLTPSEIPMQYLFRGNGLDGFISGGQRTTGLWSGFPTAFSTADVNGDAVPDVLAVDQFGTLDVFQGNGRGGFFNIHGIGRGWGRFLEVFASDDFSGDRKADVLAVSSDGGLYLYRGNGSSGFAGAGQRIGNGWAGFLAVFSPGDFTGDGRKDLLAVSKDGGLYLYQGNGLGGFIGGGQRLGNGWGSFQSVFSPGDFTGDRRADVMAVTAAGDLILYRGNGRGGLTSGSKKIGSGWNAYR